MRAYILAQNSKQGFPTVLLPEEGRSIINFVVDEVLLQKQVSDIAIVVSAQTKPLVHKHLTAMYPDVHFMYVETILEDPDEHMVLDGAVHTSLRLQDLIRYYQQYKTITHAAYNKVNPQLIPFTVYPIAAKRNLHPHTYNCGSGFCRSTNLASN